jgi:hypothetical protein
MENRGYSATIEEVVGVELTKKQIVAITTSDASTPLDAYVEENGEFIINDIAGYVKVAIHNEKANGDKDYSKYIILTNSGESFSTGSESFMNTFADIISDMEGETEEWGVKVLRKPSKNYSGKYFLTCAIV